MNRETEMKADVIIGTVMGRIGRSRIHKARALAAFHLTLIVAAVVSAVPAFDYLVSRAYQSGFSEYVSLAFSDWSYVASSWSSFMLSLAESAPVISAAILVFVVMVFIYSLRGAQRDLSALRSVGALTPIYHR